MGGRRKGRRLIFWNVAGIEKQDIEFWDYVKGYDYIGLCETWLEEQSWDKIKDKLPKSHIWISTHAKKDKIKGRAKRIILINRRKGWDKEDDTYNTIEIEEGIYFTKIIGDGSINLIFMVYKIGTNKVLGDTLMRIPENCEKGRNNYKGEFQYKNR